MRAEQYNTRIAVFPDSLLAKLGKFEPMDLLTYESEVIPMPEIVQETWRRKQAVEAIAPPTNESDLWSIGPLPTPDLEAPMIDASDERAYLFACLLDGDADGELRRRQIGVILAGDGQEMADAVVAKLVGVQGASPWDRFTRARGLMIKLRAMSAEKYLRFKGIARMVIEADDRIDAYEYAFEKALTLLVDPVFTPFELPELRHTSIDTLAKPIAVLKQHLSSPSEEANLGPFDAAMDEVFYATAEVRSAIYRDCYESFVSGGGEPNSERFLLVQALADGLYVTA